MRKKYKATVTLAWEFESEPELATEVAKERLNLMMAGCDDCRVSLKVDKSKHKTSNNRRTLGEFIPDDVLPFVTNSEERKEYKVGNKSYWVRMNSHRYFIFKASQNCAACGLLGNKMFLEKTNHDKNPHFNLYAEEDSELVLMTKDHIRARSYGGEDRHSNYQTMCIVCNNLKGSDNLNIDSIAYLRRIYNEKKKVLSRKKLNLLIKEEKKKLKLPHSWNHVSPSKRGSVQGEFKGQEQELVAKCDLLILETVEGGSLEAMSVYESPDKGKGMTPIACIKKGSVLVPKGNEGNKILVDLNGAVYKVYQGHLEYVYD